MAGSLEFVTGTAGEGELWLVRDACLVSIGTSVFSSLMGFFKAMRCRRGADEEVKKLLYSPAFCPCPPPPSLLGNFYILKYVHSVFTLTPTLACGSPLWLISFHASYIFLGQSLPRTRQVVH
ncbi:unnamed protein product [Discosporangium mesarthrocarpum]